MSDSKIRWAKVVAGTRIGYILERFSHNGPPRSMIVDGVLMIASEPIWIPVTMQNEEGHDTDTTLFIGTGDRIDVPIMKTEPDDIFEVALNTVEDIDNA